MNKKVKNVVFFFNTSEKIILQYVWRKKKLKLKVTEGKREKEREEVKERERKK